MAHFPNTFVDELAPPPPDLGEVGNAARDRLAEKGFYVGVGLSQAVAEAMSVEAQTKAIREYCPDDAEVRFPNLQATGIWLKKYGGRGVLPLMEESADDEAAFAASLWMGMKSVDPEGEVAFALRMGQRTRGKHLASDYSRVAIAASVVVFGVDPEKVTLETWGSNIAAGRVYNNIGFIETHRIPGIRQTQRLIGGISMCDRVWEATDGKRYTKDERISMQLRGLR